MATVSSEEPVSTTIISLAMLLAESRHRAITEASFFAIKTSVNAGSGGLDMEEEGGVVLKKIIRAHKIFLKAE
jgi:hypothetical protein